MSIYYNETYEEVIPEWDINFRGIPNCSHYKNDPSQMAKKIGLLKHLQLKLKLINCQFSIES